MRHHLNKQKVKILLRSKERKHVKRKVRSKGRRENMERR
jgi:hypothetical protein